MVWQPVLVFAVVDVVAGSKCESILDCSLNGECHHGVCRCDSGWTGMTCSALDLEPASITESYEAPEGTSAWGMSVVHDSETNLFHGYVSEFLNKCKLDSWTTNSYVNHVVAKRPEGPWVQRGQAIGAWAHNPKVVHSRADKTWLMFHIGSGEAHGAVQNCSGVPHAPHAPQSRPGTGARPFSLHTATSLEGPWEPVSLNVAGADGAMTTYRHFSNTDNTSMSIGRFRKPEMCRSACEKLGANNCSSYTWMGPLDKRCLIRSDERFMPTGQHGSATGRPWTFDGDNPSPLVDEATGEVRVLYRTDSTGGDPAGYHVASLIGQAWAPHWRGPYSVLSAYDGPISSPQYPHEENEDPFLWKGRRGFHGLFHACTWTDSRNKHWPASKWAGRHAYSLDGKHWTFSTEPAYNSSVQFSNGSNFVFSRMERPFLLFDKSGAPTHLFNGVQRYDWDQFTFNLMHRVRPDIAALVV